MKFEDYPFSSQLKNNLEQLGFRKPTDIQFRSIPPILGGEDLFAVAQTGTGKTAAFAIPLVDKIERRKRSSRSDAILALVMVPTRELAIQIAEVFNVLSAHLKVKAFALTGGFLQEGQIKRLQKGIDILIVTPGRMFDLVHQKVLFLESVEFLVLDEADRMLEPAFIEDIRYVKKLIKGSHQTLFFSATFSPAIKKIAYSLIKKNAIRIQISPKDPISKNVHHRVLFVEMTDKRHFLAQFIEEHLEEKILVFVRTRVRAMRVREALLKAGIESLVLHGEMEQINRCEVLQAFKEERKRILIATDVSARGIDLPGIQYVINYDLPEDPQYYVHRVGRTGRAFHRGIALSFCCVEEKEKLFAIEQYIGKCVEPLVMSKKSYAYAITEGLQEGRKPFDWASLLEEEMLFLTHREKKAKKKGKKHSSSPKKRGGQSK